MQFRFHTGPNISLCHSNVGTFYLKCSQSLELKRQYKESNRPRVERFECHGKLTIRIDVPGKEAMAKLSHDCQHEHPVDVTMPPEVKQEIEKNLHMDPRKSKQMPFSAAGTQKPNARRTCHPYPTQGNSLQPPEAHIG
jgi:hypothetical protein